MGLFRRSSQDQPPPQRLVVPDVYSGNEEFVLDQALRLVVPGFTTLTEARAAIIELVEDDDDLDVTTARAVAILEEVWRRQQAAQQTWRDLSDADRLAAAFSELEAQGVVARMSFTCCGTCGVAEIGGEVPDGASPRGYVFFHQQDADRLADPGASLYLSYGAFGDDDVSQGDYEQAAVEIGHRVKHALEANGLHVDWDGSLSRRILVRDLDWRRRLPA